MKSKFILQETIPNTYENLKLDDSLNKTFFPSYDDIIIDSAVYLSSKNKHEYDRLGDQLEDTYLRNVNNMKKFYFKFIIF